MRARLALILLSCLLIAKPFAAQEPPQRDPQAVQLLTQSYLLMGGAQRAGVKDLRVEGTLELPDAPGTAVGTFVAKARGSDFAVDTILDGQENNYRVLGGKGSVRRSDGIKPLAPYQTTGLALDILPLFARWVEFEKELTRVEAPEATTLGGVPGLRIRIRTDQQVQDTTWGNEHDSVDVFLDRSSGLVLALRYKATQGPYVQDKVLVENRFYDYQRFAGFFFPTRIVRYGNAKPRLVLRIQSVTFNNGLADSDFRNGGER